MGGGWEIRRRWPTWGAGGCSREWRLAGGLKAEIGSLKSHLQMQSAAWDLTPALGAQPRINSPSDPKETVLSFLRDRNSAPEGE